MTQARQVPPSLPQVPEKVPSILADGSVKPDAYYLRDASGNPIYVPRHRYEEFERFQRDLLSRDSLVLPAYTLEALSAKVEIANGIAQMAWNAKLRPTQKGNEIIRLRLGLRDQNLFGPVTTTGGLSSLLRPVPEGGYEWWLQADGSVQYELNFHTTAKVLANGAGNSLRLELPNAPCELQLIVPQLDQDVSIVGSGVPTVEVRTNDQQTVADIRSVGGTQVLSWRSKTENVAQDAIELESTSQLSLSEEGQIRSGNTRLQFRPSLRKKPTDIRVQLPVGMHWLSQLSGPLNAGVTVKRSEDPDEASLGETLQIRINDPSSEKNEVNLVWEWSAPPSPNGSFVFQGPKVLGVQRHVGTLEVDCSDRQRLRWENSPLLQFLQQDRTSDAARKSRHTFRFASQEYEFRATLSQLESDNRLRSRFLVRVTRDEISLVGNIDFASELVQSPDLQLHLGSWRLQNLEMDGRRLTSVQDNQGQLRLGEALQEASLGQTTPTTKNTMLSLKLEASLPSPWQPTNVEVELVLPFLSRLAANGVDRTTDHGSGDLVLSYPANLQLREETVQLAGLIADTRLKSELDDLAKRFNDVNQRAYRFPAEGPVPRWQGSLKPLRQRVLLRRHSHIDLDETTLHVRQTMHLDVLNEPLRKLQLAIPEKLFSNVAAGKERLRLRIDDQPIDWFPVADDSLGATLPENDAKSEWRIIELLASEFPASFQLQVDASHPHTWPVDALRWEGSIDLVTPHWTGEPWEMVEQTCELQIEGGLDVEIPPEYLVRPTETYRSHKELAIPTDVSHVPFVLQRYPSLPKPELQISNAVLQTMVNGVEERQRFVMDFVSHSERLAFRLPENGASQPPLFLLDGIAVSPHKSSNGYAIVLPQETAAALHRVEIWYWRIRERGLAKSIEGRLPSFDGNTNQPSWVWQVLLPQGETLVWSQPASQSILSKVSDLAEASSLGNSTDRRLAKWPLENPSASPTEGTKSLLLFVSSLHDSPKILVIARSAIWGPVGIWVLLVCGFASYRLPWRRPLLFFFAGAALIASSWLALSATLLIAQIIGVTILVLLLTHAITWLTRPPSAKRSIYSPSLTVRPSLSNSHAATKSTQAIEPTLSPSLEESR